MAILRNLALILLAVEAFVMALIPLAMLGGLVYGTWWLRRHENLPSWLKLAHAYLDLGRAYVELAMSAVARPIFVVHSFLARIQGLLGAIARLGGDR